jgi:hypothetical protein
MPLNSKRKIFVNQTTDIFFTNDNPQPQIKIKKDFNKSNIVFDTIKDVRPIRKSIENRYQPKFEEETPYARRMRQYYSSSVDTTRYSSTSYGALDKECITYQYFNIDLERKYKKNYQTQL